MGRLKFKRALVALHMFGVHASNVSPVGHYCIIGIVVAVRFNTIGIQSAYQTIERRCTMEALERGQIPIFFENWHVVTNPLAKKFNDRSFNKNSKVCQPCMHNVIL